MSDDFPYARRYPVLRGLPDHGRPRAEILAELAEMAAIEDAAWETGRVSGTMYAGDHAHYAFLTEAFGRFAHASALQRDLSPSATRFEGEIIAMALDLMHADAVHDGEPVGMVTTGGTGSILHALLAYREHAAEHRGITQGNIVKAETGHPAFDKGSHMFGLECRVVPVDPATTAVDPAVMAQAIDANTLAIVGSAGNYPYGTIDPIAELGALAVERGVGLHVDACLGGFILPFGEQLGYPVPVFDFRIPGVSSISADTHKYGYAFKGSSVVLFRDRALRNSQYFHVAGWSGGKYMSPGIEGSRSVGLLSATWAAMVSLGRQGYLTHAAEIFGTARAMMDAVSSHPELRLMGTPWFCFSFTSDEFDVYHVNDFMKPRGWRFNGQQYPNAIHMAVTRPQTQPGVVQAFDADLAEAVDYAKAEQSAGRPATSGAIYGGYPGGLTSDVEEFILSIMEGMLDQQQSVPAPEDLE